MTYTLESATDALTAEGYPPSAARDAALACAHPMTGELEEFDLELARALLDVIA